MMRLANGNGDPEDALTVWGGTIDSLPGTEPNNDDDTSGTRDDAADKASSTPAPVNHGPAFYELCEKHLRLKWMLDEIPKQIAPTTDTYGLEALVEAARALNENAGKELFDLRDVVVE